MSIGTIHDTYKLLVLIVLTLVHTHRLAIYLTTSSGKNKATILKILQFV
jgi:hypothetical protein